MPYRFVLTTAGLERIAAVGLNLVITDLVAGDGDTGAGPAPISNDPAVLEAMTSLVNERYATPDVSVVLSAVTPATEFVASAEIPASANFTLHEAGLEGPDKDGNPALLAVGGVAPIEISDTPSAVIDAEVRAVVQVSNTSAVTITLAADVLATHGYVDDRVWPRPFASTTAAVAGVTSKTAVKIDVATSLPWEVLASPGVVSVMDGAFTDGIRIFHRAEDIGGGKGLIRATDMFTNSYAWDYYGTAELMPAACTNINEILCVYRDGANALSIVKLDPQTGGVYGTITPSPALSTTDDIYAVAYDDHIYIGTGQYIYKINLSTGARSQIVNLGGGNDCTAMAISGEAIAYADTAGNIGVADLSGTDIVASVSASTAQITSIAMDTDRVYAVGGNTGSFASHVSAAYYRSGAFESSWGYAAAGDPGPVFCDSRFLYFGQSDAATYSTVHVFDKRTGQRVTAIGGVDMPCSDHFHLYARQSPAGAPSATWDKIAIPGHEQEIHTVVDSDDYLVLHGRQIQGRES